MRKGGGPEAGGRAPRPGGPRVQAIPKRRQPMKEARRQRVDR
jgi:hypothetical protein